MIYSPLSVQKDEPARGIYTYNSTLYTWIIALIAVIFWTGLIIVVNGSSPRTLVSFHGLLHAAIAEKFVDSPLPFTAPENPFFAGKTIPYYWFFHFLGAQVAGLLNLNVLYGMKTVILISLGAMTVSSILLGRKLFRSTLAGLLIGFLVLAGTNPFGFLYAGYNVLKSGLQVLADDPTFRWGIVHPLFMQIRIFDGSGLYGPFINFFFNMTSRPAAISTLIVLIFFLYQLLKTGGWFQAFLVALVTALLTGLSPIMGISSVAALVTGIAGIFLWEKLIERKAQTSKKPLVAAGMLLFGVLAAWPTFRHLIIGPSQSTIEFILFSKDGLRQFLMIGLSIFPLFVLALAGIWKRNIFERKFLIILFIAACIQLLFAAALSLPEINQSNFFLAAGSMLSVPAAGSILIKRRQTQEGVETSRRLASPRLTGLVVLFFLPTFLLVLISYLNRPGLPMATHTTEIKRLPVESGYGALYEWIIEETFSDAVFALDPRERIAIVGNVFELPAITGRSILVEAKNHYLVAPYSDAEERFRLTVNLVTGEQLGPSDQATLRKLGRPVFIVHACTPDNAETMRLNSLYKTSVYEQDEICVYRWIENPPSK